MSELKTITVIGATGMLGTPVTEELVRAGFQVRALVRNMDKARRKLPAEVILMEGDIRDSESLEKAFQNADGVYVSLSTYPDEHHKDFKTESDGIKNIVGAAEKTSIKRIAYLSSLVHRYEEFDWWAFDIKRAACEILKRSSIPITLFYPSNFMENLPHLHLQGNWLILLGRQKTKSWYVAAEDYGKQVAQSFKQLTGGETREYPVQGPEAFNFEEAAKEFAKHYSKKDLNIIVLPMWLMRTAGIFSREIRYGAKITEAINHYDEKFRSEHTWEELGKPEITLAEFARRR